jgi:hypothetical protein
VREKELFPTDVARVRIDSSVLVLNNAFAFKHKLREVELHDGIVKLIIIHSNIAH